MNRTRRRPKRSSSPTNSRYDSAGAVFRRAGAARRARPRASSCTRTAAATRAGRRRSRGRSPAAESSTATTPRSVVERISRPTPCASRTAAIGTLTAANPEPPAASTAADRAAASGSSGRGNGSRSMTTSWHASPGHVDALPQRHDADQAASPGRRGTRGSAAATTPRPAAGSSGRSVARSTSAARSAARREENSPRVRPPSALTSATSSSAAASGRPDCVGRGRCAAT